MKKIILITLFTIFSAFQLNDIPEVNTYVITDKIVLLYNFETKTYEVKMEGYNDPCFVINLIQIAYSKECDDVITEKQFEEANEINQKLLEIHNDQLKNQQPKIKTNSL